MKTTNNDKLLFVDDEQYFLDSIQRQFEDKYNLVTASGGREALRKLKAEGPFSVVVADMHMPEMDGITFLKQVRQEDNNSIRIMLTGDTDLETAIVAVNEGNIFRFATKPCSFATLEKIIDAALMQYRLIQAEQELLENTFKGAVKVLVDILSLTNPIAFGRASRLKHYVRHLALELNLENVWYFEVAALLSQIGCVTIPSEILLKISNKQQLSQTEETMLQAYPEVGHNLIANIPRLEAVAEMVASQQVDFARPNIPADELTKDIAALGSEMLKVAIDFDELLLAGYSKVRALHALNNNTSKYNPILLDAIKEIELPDFEIKVVTVSIKELRTGMYLESDIYSQKNVLLAKKGQEVTSTMLIMLENYLRQGAIDKNVLVSVSTYQIE